MAWFATLSEPEAESFEKGGRGEPERSSRKIFNFKFLIQTLDLKQPQEDIGHYDTEELVESGTFENSRDRVCVWIGRVRLPPLDRIRRPALINFILLTPIHYSIPRINSTQIIDHRRHAFETLHPPRQLRHPPSHLSFYQRRGTSLRRLSRRRRHDVHGRSKHKSHRSRMH